MTLVLDVPRVRAAHLDDRELLGAFRCSRGPWFEDEVEVHIQRNAVAEWEWRAPHLDHRLLLIEDRVHGLVAVGAHEEAAYRRGAEEIKGTYLAVAAVALDLRGAEIADQKPWRDGRPFRLSDYLMEAMLSDSVERGRGGVVRAVMARENTNSIELCDRWGLTATTPDRDERYLQKQGVLG